MSHTNPNYSEVLKLTTGVLGKQFCKSYLNLAKSEFRRNHGIKATLDNAQELRDIYERQWHDYYIGRPLREKQNKEVGRPIWDFVCPYKKDCLCAQYRFLEHKYSPVITREDGSTYLGKSYGVLKEGMNIEFSESYIIQNGLFEEFKTWFLMNLKTLNPYRKPKFIDYSHPAYSGVTDDF